MVRVVCCRPHISDDVSNTPFSMQRDRELFRLLAMRSLDEALIVWQSVQDPPLPSEIKCLPNRATTLSQPVSDETIGEMRGVGVVGVGVRVLSCVAGRASLIPFVTHSL